MRFRCGGEKTEFEFGIGQDDPSSFCVGSSLGCGRKQVVIFSVENAYSRNGTANVLYSSTATRLTSAASSSPQMSLTVDIGITVNNIVLLHIR